MRKTKIVCTVGPATDSIDVLRDLMKSGMNVARFNFSHGSYEEHKGRLDMLKAVRAELNKPVAALLDTKGPEIRLKEFKNGVEMLEAGQTFTLTTREVEGTKEICSITYKDLPQDVQPGGTIMLDDGLIKLQIQTVNDTDIVCTVLNNGKIKNKKGVNVPGVHLSMPYMSQRDRDDIIFGAQQGFDFIAASFVRTAQDVYDIRNLLNEYASNIRIIPKIQNRDGVNYIDSILSAAAAVMGELMGIRPIITLIDGKTKVESKVRGDDKVVPAMVELCKKRAEDVEDFEYMIGHTNIPQAADLEKACRKAFGKAPLIVFELGGVVSANTGPDTVALVYTGHPRG